MTTTTEHATGALTAPTGGVQPPLPQRARVVVVGSGFAGLAAAIRLKREGRTDFVVLERGDDVGGTWRDNVYPGCACDVPSHLYSFSFAPNPDWSRSFSPQPEIQAYLQRTARDFGVMPHVHLRTEMLDARWDDAAQRWDVETNRGSVSAEVLVVAAGPLSEPSIPNLPGLDSFAGTTFHSATWRHDHDLTGERVAVIGTGASAIQFVPHVQQRAGQMTLFQRTAPWVMPRRDRAITKLEKAAYKRIPGAQKVARASIYTGRESWLLGFTVQPKIMAVAELMARRHLAEQVPDPVLRDKLTPRYRLGCKRVLLSNEYYPALAADNAEVVTEGVVEVLPHAVVTESADGTRTEHPADTIIWGTGFRVTDPPVAERIAGCNGRRLSEEWAENGMQALHGLTMSGFPNLFFLVGPNTGLGHTSIVYMAESQVNYLLDALNKMDAQGLTAIEPRADVQRRYNEEIQRELEGTVWNAGGCSSWYLDKKGRNTTLWPTWTFAFRRRTKTADLSEYVARDRRTPVEVAA